MSNSNFYLMLLINKLYNFAPVAKDIHISHLNGVNHTYTKGETTITL